MGFLSTLEGIGKGIVHGVEDVVLVPSEVAHWALGKMFGNSDAELEKLAAELDAMGKQVEQLSQEINSALSHLTWHGPASDAFVGHAQGRVRELAGVSDELHGLSKAVTQLAHVY
ncbi:WXG100 family type VII secretion target [Kitasatospora sp. McL0602]|uniref:WXG100 family type VII secretion target n=1 Tax=Kitasatospora sp. McL0602 TaxID=3439530 RepID=UPI003F893908